MWFLPWDTGSITTLLGSCKFSSTTVTPLGLHADFSLVYFGLYPSVLQSTSLKSFTRRHCSVYTVAAVDTYVMLHCWLCDLFLLSTPVNIPVSSSACCVPCTLYGIYLVVISYSWLLPFSNPSIPIYDLQLS